MVADLLVLSPVPSAAAEATAATAWAPSGEVDDSWLVCGKVLATGSDRIKRLEIWFAAGFVSELQHELEDDNRVVDELDECVASIVVLLGPLAHAPVAENLRVLWSAVGVAAAA
jgi:hypothetical protein